VQLVFVHTGSLTVAVGCDELAVGAGSCCLLLPGRVEFFRFSRVTTTVHSWVHYWSAATDRELVARLATVARTQRISAGVARLVGALLSESQVARPLTVLRSYEILYRYIHDAGHPSAQPAALGTALAFVHQRYVDAIGVDDVAVAAAVSRSQLFRMFRQHVGTTPAEYIWQLRVTHAIQLLRETGLPVAEISQRCGFQNAKHLARRVRLDTGQSPRQVRLHALG
jgi:transcriptional regulator GlxA family with amidase domain